MDKSRVESAVQELPNRSERGKRDVSSMRALDKLLLGTERAEPASPAPSPVDEEPVQDPNGIDEVLFDDVIFDEAELHELETEGDVKYGTPSEFDPSQPDVAATASALQTYQNDASESVPFADALLANLLAELRAPLATALADAERVLVEPDRVAIWFENQARRRLLSLVSKFSDELQATEVKRVLTSPPVAGKDA